MKRPWRDLRENFQRLHKYLVVRETGSRNVSPYAVHALSDGEVRLVILKPQSDIDATIECYLEVVDLKDSEQPFEALSYTWGPPVDGQILPDRTILLDGVIKKVRGNLYNALKQFRHADCSRYLWIDALCINQESSVERSHQVSIMGRIFAKAAKVIVWLGEDSDVHDGEVSIAFFRSVLECEDEVMSVARFDERWAAFKLALLNPQTTFTRLVTAKFPQYLCERDDVLHGRVNQQYNFALQSSERFFNRRYFQRRWVLQEIFHAQDANVYCGPHTISWSAMVSAAQKHYTQRPDRKVPFLRPRIFNLGNLEVYDRGGNAAVMFNLMNAFLDNQCQDPRDRLYALLSLQTLPCMRPDYSSPATRLWTNFSIRCISEGLVHTIIHVAAFQLTDQQGARDSALRSWVPDFSLNYRHRDIGIVGTKNDHDSVAIVDSDNALLCSLTCLGEIVTHNGWALISPDVTPDTLPDVPTTPPTSSRAHFPSTISNLKPIPGQNSSLRFDGHTSFNLRNGDILCQGPTTHFIMILRELPPTTTTKSTTTSSSSENVKTYRVMNMAEQAFRSQLLWPAPHPRRVRIV